MKIDGAAPAAAAQMSGIQSKQSAKPEEKASATPTQNYDKVELSDAAKSMMAASKTASA